MPYLKDAYYCLDTFILWFEQLNSLYASGEDFEELYSAFLKAPQRGFPNLRWVPFQGYKSMHP